MPKTILAYIVMHLVVHLHYQIEIAIGENQKVNLTIKFHDKMRRCAECRFDLPQVKVTFGHFVYISKFCVWIT
jgi:hypothetical protein